jgi:TM2 domain-containing membrane protein YozV
MKTCPYCAEQIQEAAVVCRFCQRAVLSGVIVPANQTATLAPVSTWSPGAAAVLSFFVPGLGHVYKGHIGLGLVLFCATILGYFMLVLPGVIIHICVIADAYNGKPADRPAAASVPERAARTLTVAEIAAQKRNLQRQNMILGGIFAGLLVFGGLVVALMPKAERSGRLSDRRTASAAPVESAQQKEFRENAEWATRLEKIVIADGKPCGRALDVTARGRSPRDDASLWIINCAGGEGYFIRLVPGKPPRVLPR